MRPDCRRWTNWRAVDNILVVCLAQAIGGSRGVAGARRRQQHL